MNHILLIDKPAGWTSFDVVAKVRSQIRQNYQSRGEKPTKRQLKVGHAGTLDPFATGLLIILLGDECQNAQQYLKLDKTYEFTAKLGEVSTTGDPEGDISAFVIPESDRESSKIMDPLIKPEDDKPSIEEIKQILKQFTGEILQKPPAYSAIKIDGKRAYKLAREGKTVEMPTRSVTVRALDIMKYQYPYLQARCQVSSGTYIRSLVEDIGQKLQVGAYCVELRRTRVGRWDIADALTIEHALKVLQTE